MSILPAELALTARTFQSHSPTMITATFVNSFGEGWEKAPSLDIRKISVLGNPSAFVATEQLGIDGVVVSIVDVEKSLVHGQGEWDPPGGWKPFTVRLGDGTRVIED